MNNFEFLKIIFNIDFLSALLGFIGTLFIFFFGLPPKVDPDGHTNLILEQENEEDKRQGKIYKKLGYLGILFITASFLLQIIKLLII